MPPLMLKRGLCEAMQLTCQSALPQRLLVKGDLRVLELQHQLQDLRVLRRRRSGHRLIDPDEPTKKRRRSKAGQPEPGCGPE